MFCSVKINVCWRFWLKNIYQGIFCLKFSICHLISQINIITNMLFLKCVLWHIYVTFLYIILNWYYKTCEKMMLKLDTFSQKSETLIAVIWIFYVNNKYSMYELSVRTFFSCDISMLTFKGVVGVECWNCRGK